MPEFIASLKAQGVRVVADVREAPISRKKGFAKSALAAALAEEGIGYRHWRALGCPKVIRDDYRSDGDWARYTERFMAHLAMQQSALDELAAVCASAPTALLCYERDFNRCHRTYVAGAVAERLGGEVQPVPPLQG